MYMSADQMSIVIFNILSGFWCEILYLRFLTAACKRSPTIFWSTARLPVPGFASGGDTNVDAYAKFLLDLWICADDNVDLLVVFL